MYQYIWRGMAVGMSEAVPGVSGSTVAMILAIYERLIYNLSLLSTKHRKEALPFLVPFGVGMVVGFALSIVTIHLLLTHFRAPTLIFFVGIIVGFLPVLWQEGVKQAKRDYRLIDYIVMILFITVVVVASLFSDFNQIELTTLAANDVIFLMVAGFVASTALVLPGISGALMLTILGVYELATASLVQMHWPVIFSIGIGVIAGVLFMSRLIQYLLNHYTQSTYAAMVGLVAGSIFVIFNTLTWGEIQQHIILSVASGLLGLIFVSMVTKSVGMKG
ncbi:DUF368 domain-containing protein [Alkalibacillus haloalkaliphilus]|uniref:DUF368 domain-containing protein n=1 Tax=Alkalibacillus haloalkaliphilus TaxID=94136 RepID=A0A511W497_9BACI|nr:DUF368 domain-containing protein [Alkalibacillus haloalkaliphilus]GEN45591.1 DUF368 domain-containing protein [Alkalibacillus haloalkaliphilus]